MCLPAARLAVFDNDGTLWTGAAAVHPARLCPGPGRGARRRAPGMEDDPAVPGGARGRPRRACKAGLAGIEQIVGATHAGMTSEEFDGSPTTGSIVPSTRDSIGRTRAWPTSRWSRSSSTSGRMGSRPTSFPGAGSSSCARSPIGCTAIPPDQVVGSSIKIDVRAAGRHAGARPPGRDRLLRRQGRQAGRHPEVHRPAADRGLRQLRRRPADAPVDRRTVRPQPRCPRRSHGRGPRVRLSGLADGDPEARARGGESARLDGRQHEGRLEGDLRPE